MNQLQRLSPCRAPARRAQPPLGDDRDAAEVAVDIQRYGSHPSLLANWPRRGRRALLASELIFGLVPIRDRPRAARRRAQQRITRCPVMVGVEPVRIGRRPPLASKYFCACACEEKSLPLHVDDDHRPRLEARAFRERGGSARRP
jgi:hypothetical protein